MNRINCIVADDEELARGIIESYIAKLPQLHLVASCSNGTEVYNTLKEKAAHLLFLDIKMPQLTGIELLRTLKNPPLVVMTTAYSEFALEVYELNVIDYLLKPISFERFLKAINKYENITNPSGRTLIANSIEEPEHESQTFIYVRSDKKMVRLLIKDILYIKGLKDYVQLYTVDKTIITYQTLTYLEEKLPANRFMRIHRSFIISLDHISAFSATQIDLGKHSIPIGNSYSKEVLKKLQT
ncbi:LytTR family DNA-binding domain-containing protein [Chitinophaga sp. S165]|uniref:LytR/AlgR family response regulator transcription factor n=1 Tax=Chitinophaga sp. S165 TaxID=2135462 RepID=UPI000D70B7D4|nr:LytTR family DNA-binding domain-containing protein [Chitinophaga sp. S165]PWV49052.1 LytTR family two component transcriptional regulator [Chitinophaga sp. S165]